LRKAKAEARNVQLQCVQLSLFLSHIRDTMPNMMDAGERQEVPKGNACQEHMTRDELKELKNSKRLKNSATSANKRFKISMSL